ncbi:MAG: hypothetical protein C0392_11260 [Syntrophus sp. (in: bacteria)]|nr:hypothetical protein [Syntrophus sp. (in: bacteria)]
MQLITGYEEWKRKGLIILKGKLAKGGTDKVKEVCIAFCASLLFHICIIALFFGLSTGARTPVKTITVDFALLNDEEGMGRGVSGIEGKGNRNKPTKPEMARAKMDAPLSRPRSPSGVTKEAETAQTPLVEVEKHKIMSDPAGTVSIHGKAVPVGYSGEMRTGASMGAGGGYGGPGAGIGSGGSGTGTGTAGGGIQGGKDYYYIRDTVMRNIKYPEKARRMGMEGQVLLSFIVLENGVMSEIRVVRSSGFRVLDDDAKDTVAKTRIERKVPYRAAVNLPITYKLQ